MFARRWTREAAAHDQGVVAEFGGRLTSDPNRSSLGLLPSGPDPVGEWLVHRQPPDPYISGTQRACKPPSPAPCLLSSRKPRSYVMILFTRSPPQPSSPPPQLPPPTIPLA